MYVCIFQELECKKKHHSPKYVFMYYIQGKGYLITKATKKMDKLELQHITAYVHMDQNDNSAHITVGVLTQTAKIEIWELQRILLLY